MGEGKLKFLQEDEKFYTWDMLSVFWGFRPMCRSMVIKNQDRGCIIHLPILPRVLLRAGCRKQKIC
jgi:hypothetical protein